MDIFPREFTFSSTLFYILFGYFIVYVFIKIYEYLYDVHIIKCSHLKWKDIDPFYSEPVIESK